jgi:hypothetical protein
MVEGGESVEVCFLNYLGTEKVRLFWGGINAFLTPIKIINIRKTCFFFNDLCNMFLKKRQLAFKIN